MRKLYPLAASTQSIIRLLCNVGLVSLALGSSIVLLLRMLSTHTNSKRMRTEEVLSHYPGGALADHASQSFSPFEQQAFHLAAHRKPAPAVFHFAAFFPNVPTRFENATMVPAAYPSLVEFEHQFEMLERRFPKLVSRQLIGVSAAQQRPLWAIRVSDNPHLDEDEPAILFTALHHAREPAGVFICQAIMEELLNNYGRSARHTRWVDSLDIWFVPLVNPDGYEYLLKSQRRFPWWRKNLRDNDQDGKFDPLIDGVDLNRNYDYNWEEGGEAEYASWFYRGKSAFSEPEIQALRDLELRRNFVLGVSFHSYGEAVLYPWGNFNPAPDQDLILDIAHNYAAQIGRVNGDGQYNVLPLNGRVGQSSVWRYGFSSAIDFICETGEDYFPRGEDLPRIVAENVRGVNFLFERALRCGISGHVRDAQTGEPLSAEIVLAGFESTYVKPRHSQGAYGRFERLLMPGNYTLLVRKSGYYTAQFNQVMVHDSTLTYLEVELQREAARPSISSH